MTRMNKNDKIDYHHIPVLLNEVINLLSPQKDSTIIDATLGGAGYSQEILKKIGKQGHLVSVDLDYEALKNATEIKEIKKLGNWILVHENFKNIDKIVEKHQIKNISGIVADLGLSSNQLDNSERGISFQKKELLDMRFDISGDSLNARFILANYDENQLIKVFKEFGEEKFSKQIARKIQDIRLKNSIKYTTDLYQIIEDALPKPVKHRASDSARRVFQALRMEVNKELDNLREFLQKSFDLLAPGGRMAIVSFHSLEDRIVKHFFQDLAKGCVCPIDFPECRCGRNPKAKILTKKPIVASEKELKINSRSKPAKLRGVQKI